MRKSRPYQDQSSSGSRELILNLKQQNQPAQNAISSIWKSFWIRFEHDIYSYIIPSMEQIEQPQQNMNPLQYPINIKNIPRHTFCLQYTLRQIKKLQVLYFNTNIDLVSEVRKQTTGIFYRISNIFVNKYMRSSEKQLFQTVIQGYERIKTKINVLFQCLFLVLKREITKKAIQQEFFYILLKQMMNHSNYQKYINSCIKAVQSLRNSCFRNGYQLLKSSEGFFKEQFSSTIKQLKTLLQLKIFPYVEYIQRSKKYYKQLLPRMPKNIWMFSTLYCFIKLQKMLQNIIIADSSYLKNKNTLLSNEPWRIIQEQSVIQVICKEVLQEFYQDLIEYIQYLLQSDNLKPQTYQIKDQKQIVVPLLIQDKFQLLRYMWYLTKILEKQITKQKMANQSKTGLQIIDQKLFTNQFNPKTKLLQRISLIVGDIKKFIKNNQNYKQNQLHKISKFRHHIVKVISQCFDNDAKIISAITMKIQQSIAQQQEIFNEKLCKIILSPTYVFYGSQADTNASKKQMLDEDEQSKQQNDVVALNNKASFELFQLTSSKQQFIRKFEQQFAAYILENWNLHIDCKQQQLFIKSLQKQSGYSLSRNIEKMLHDVWDIEKQTLVVQKYDIFVCRVLSKDWPRFHDSTFRLADSLAQVREQFQNWYLNRAQNEKKKIKWVQQFGKITLSISGVVSNFNELQTSIIVLLSKSFRPMKAQQFVQILQYTSNDIKQILADLVQGNVVVYNQNAQNYELNFQNENPYSFERKRKIQLTTKKKSVQKDYVFVIQAHIIRILKRRKSVQKTDLSKLLSSQIKVDGHIPTIQQINQAIEKLKAKEFISIQKTRGIIKYVE